MDQTRWLSDEEQSLWRLMLAGRRKVDRCIDETLQADSDLSVSEFAVLVSLSEYEGEGMRLRDLCLSLDWDRSRTSHQITRMERRGLVSKLSCAGDARGVIVTLTDEGLERLRAAAPGHVATVRRLVFDHLEPADADALRRFLTNVLSIVDGESA